MCACVCVCVCVCVSVGDGEPENIKRERREGCMQLTDQEMRAYLM